MSEQQNEFEKQDRRNNVHIAERLAKIEASISKIEVALVGNPPMGQKGIVQRLETLETRVEKHDKKLILWGGIVTGAIFIAQFVINLLSKGFGK